MSSNTSINNKIIAYCHKTTIIKVKIQNAINFFEKQESQDFNKDVFWSNGVFHTINFRISKSSNLYIFKNNPTRKKAKSQKKMMTIDQIKKIKEVL